MGLRGNDSVLERSDPEVSVTSSLGLYLLTLEIDIHLGADDHGILVELPCFISYVTD